MPVLSLATSPIVTYDTLTKCFAILAIYIIFIFFCCCILGYHRRSSQSSAYSRETARLVSGYHRNTAPIIRVVVVAPESRPTSARTQSFPQPPPIYGRGAQPAVKTPVATNHERNLYRSGSVPPPGAGESRQTLSSPARTQASYQPPSTHSPTQTTVGALASAGHGSIHYGSTLTTPSHAGGSRQIASIVPYSQSSSRHAPKPVAYPAHISKLSQPSLTHALNQPPAYPQVPTSIGGSKPTHVALPSPVPAVPVSDEIENVENVNTAEELRERARGHDRQMHHERKLAKSAHKRGDINAERGHKEKATAHQSAKKALNEKAADIIFNENNKHHKEGTVDLHGLYVPEAVQYATKELKSASRRENGRVVFIVGKGLHCNAPGDVKIRPALQDLCNKRGLTHSLDPRNAGCLIVQAR